MFGIILTAMLSKGMIYNDIETYKNEKKIEIKSDLKNDTKKEEINESKKENE